ncbi:MAG: hypothetical protein AAGK77_14220 [Pseudomonadota bacterium]
MTYLNHTSLRAAAAVLTGIAGGATAQAMTLWGSDLSRFLPPMPLLSLAAAFGAAGAGALLADAWGRQGWRGCLLSILIWPVATVLGACLAVMPFGLVEHGWPSNAVLALADAFVTTAPLGIFAVLNGITSSVHVAAIWLISGVLVHIGLRAERQRPI